MARMKLPCFPTIQSINARAPHSQTLCKWKMYPRRAADGVELAAKGGRAKFFFGSGLVRRCAYISNLLMPAYLDFGGFGKILDCMVGLPFVLHFHLGIVSSSGYWRVFILFFSYSEFLNFFGGDIGRFYNQVTWVMPAQQRKTHHKPSTPQSVD